MEDILAKLHFTKAHTILLSKKKVVRKLHAHCAHTSLQRARGLMLRKLPPKHCLIFPMPKKYRVSLHMFFVFYPIDVIFARKNKNNSFEILEIKENFQPFHTLTSKEACDLVIELPRHESKGFTKGDVLKVSLTQQ